MYDLHKKAVITGCASSFCLTCDEFLTSRHDADVHVNSSGHQTCLANAKFADEFKDDHIWKIKWGYFCEFCNILLPIAAKVSVHINDERHKQKKIDLLSITNGTGVSISNVYIEESSWHGLSEDICFVCNVEIDDPKEHKNERKHCLNLVLRSVQIGEKNSVYREVDDSTIQCLTCNILLSLDNKTTHFNTEEHIKTYNKCLINNKDTPILNKKKYESKAPKVKIDQTENKTKILDSIAKYQKDSVQINLERDTAYCKKCLIVVEFDPNVIEQHINEHSKNSEVKSELQYPSKLDQSHNKTDIKEGVKPSTSSAENNNNGESTSASPTSDLESNDSDKFEFAKANDITCNEGHSTAFCNMCQVKLPSHLPSMKEHVKGMSHKKKAANVKVPKTENTHGMPHTKKAGIVNVPKTENTDDNNTKIKKQSFKDFVEHAWQIKLYTDDYETVVNEDYCMTQSSYFMIRINGPTKRCMLCLVNLPPNESERDHVQNDTHRRLSATRVYVITSLKSEFIREIRPNEYHCAYCNLVEMSWSNMEKHLQCKEHQRLTLLYRIKLLGHLPTIREHRRRTERDVDAFIFILMMNAMRNNAFSF